MISQLFYVLIRNWKLTLSYTFDWIVIIVIAAVGAVLNYIRPYHRLFSVLDLNISFPIESELSIVTVGIVAGIAPAVIILLIVALFVPGPKTSHGLKQSERFKWKAWELERGWAGLALALATAFFITQGSKQLFGKPRPNMLARCQPDLSNIESHVVAGYGSRFSPEWTLVDISICTTTDRSSLDDGFRSFPSGHSSFSWAGLLYLTLFLCAKLRISIPFLPTQIEALGRMRQQSQRSNDFELQQTGTGVTGDRNVPLINADDFPENPHAVRSFAASPPNYLLVVAGIPIGVAVYISSTRYAEYYHFGFDIIAGSLLGILTALLGFYWCHLPLGSGLGWATGIRSKNRAFGIGVGTEGYIERESDMEMGLRDARHFESRGDRIV